MRVRRLVMLRHGQTDYNAGSRMQGQLDTELSDLGRDQAVAAAEVLAKRQPLGIGSSDLRRALYTAGALGGMGNASGVKLSGHSGTDGSEDIRWRLDVWNASAQVANDVL